MCIVWSKCIVPLELINVVSAGPVFRDDFQPFPTNTQHLHNIYNVGPTSKTLVQRCTHVIQMFCVCWVTTLTYFCINHGDKKCFFSFWNHHNVLVDSFRIIWIPKLWVYTHCKYFRYFSLKMVPVLKRLKLSYELLDHHMIVLVNC